jgi:hypothetical protein
MCFTFGKPCDGNVERLAVPLSNEGQRFHVCYVATKIIATSLIIVSNIYTRYDAETKGLHMVFTAGTNERYFGGQQGLIEAICHS